jgi:WD40 repeat protein
LKNKRGLAATRFLILAVGMSSVFPPSPARAASADGWWSSIQSTFGLKDTAHDVAKKIAEFTEDRTFVVGGLDFNGDGAQLATNGQVAGPEVHVWNWRAPSHIARVLSMNSSAGGGAAIRYSLDGSLLAVGHVLDRPQVGSGLVRIWNTQTWAIAHDIAEPQGASAQMGFAFSPDGRLFIRTMDRFSGPNLIVHRTDTWEQLWSVSTPGFTPLTLALSPDGQFVAVAGWSSTPEGPPFGSRPQILIVDLSSRRIVRTFAAFPDNNIIQALSWSPDGKMIAAGAIIGGSPPGPDAVKIFDPQSGKQLIGEPATDAAFVSGLQYSRDGRYLIEAYIDGNVRIWDGQHKLLLQKIPIDMRFHPAVSISRDSRYFAVAVGRDVSVWDLK